MCLHPPPAILDAIIGRHEATAKVERMNRLCSASQCPVRRCTQDCGTANTGLDWHEQGSIVPNLVLASRSRKAPRAPLEKSGRLPPKSLEVVGVVDALYAPNKSARANEHTSVCHYRPPSHRRRRNIDDGETVSTCILRTGGPEREIAVGADSCVPCESLKTSCGRGDIPKEQ